MAQGLLTWAVWVFGCWAALQEVTTRMGKRPLMFRAEGWLPQPQRTRSLPSLAVSPSHPSIFMSRAWVSPALTRERVINRVLVCLPRLKAGIVVFLSLSLCLEQDLLVVGGQYMNVAGVTHPDFPSDLILLSLLAELISENEIKTYFQQSSSAL